MVLKADQPQSTSIWPSFSISRWREQLEEEKRKKKAAAQLAQEEKQYQLHASQVRQSREHINPTNNKYASPEAYRMRAKEVRTQTQEMGFGKGFLPTPETGLPEQTLTTKYPPLSYDQDPRRDPLIQYQRLARAIGKEAVGSRLAAITDIWNANCAPYDGSGVIWELTNSKFTLDEVKNMVEQARYVLHDSSKMGPLMRATNIDQMRGTLESLYNLSGHQWQAFNEIFEQQRKGEMPTGWEEDPLGTILVLSTLIPGVGAAVKAGEAVGWGARIARIGSKVLDVAKFGGKFTLGMEAITSLGEMYETRRVEGIQKQEEAAEADLALVDTPLSLLTRYEEDSPLKQIRDLRINMTKLNGNPQNREDIKAMQRAYQEEGVGVGLPVTGVFDPDWQDEIINAAQDAVRVVYEEQRMAIEDGDAGYEAEINGNMDDPYWQDVFARRDDRLAAKEEQRVLDPDTYEFYERSGIPRNKLELDAMGRRLAQNGALQAVYGSLLQGALTLGRATDATFCALNLNLRQRKDPGYQRRVKALCDYVDQQEMDDLQNQWLAKPEKCGETFARWATEGPDSPLKNDPLAQKLLQALNEKQAGLITQRYDADTLISLGLMVGADYDTMTQFGVDHPDMVRAFTTGTYIAIAKANPMGRVYRGAFKPKVASTKVAFGASARADAITGRLANYIHEMDTGRAASYIKGTGAKPVVNEFTHITGTKPAPTTPKSTAVKQVAADVVKGYETDGIAGVRKATGGKSKELLEAIQGKMTELKEATPETKTSAIAKILADRQTKYGEVPALAKPRTGHYDPDSKLFRDISREIVDAVDDGMPQRVGDILKGAPDEFIDQVVNAATEGKARGGATRAEVRGWVGEVVERAIVERKVSNLIAKRQSASRDAISKEVMKTRFKEHLAEEWGRGADIFPYFRDNRLSPPSRTLGAITKRITQIKNDWLRSFLTRFTVGQITRAPTAEIELNDLNTLDRVYDAAMLVSQDAGWAWTFRNRWASSMSEAHLVKLLNEMEVMFNRKYNTRAPSRLTGRTIEESLGAQHEAGGQAMVPEPLSPLESGELGINWGNVSRTPMVKEYVEAGTGKTIQPLPDTVYAQYIYSLHRSALWAPYRVPDGLGSLLHPTDAAAFFKTATLASKNVYRYLLGVTHRGSTFLRQWTVAMGAPLLFQKHAITDTFRTAMDEGSFSILQAFGLRGVTVRGHTLVPEVQSALGRSMERTLAEVSPGLRDAILYAKARVHASEAQWLSGTRRVTYVPKTIYDVNNKIVDAKESAEALRRVTEGEAFKVWARDGLAGVTEWLATKQGRAFLDRSGWTTYADQILKESDIRATKSTLYQKAADEYIDSVVEKEFMRLDKALPDIMPELKQMALNDSLLDVKRIQELIKTVDPNRNNAVLSLPAKEWGNNGMAGYVVGKAMAANKWNRDVVFDHSFTRQYRQLRKDGLEADNAARIAATVAELTASRIHFDLSNALAIEARHRWLAWFATKHRLYGVYMLKLAAERPTIAAAAVSIMDWMKERNERIGVGEFDKYDLVLPNGKGGQWRFNLAPLMWFSEYPLESSAAIALEHIALPAVNAVTGLELHPSPAPFGLTFTRADTLVMMIADAAGSEWVKTPEDLQKWLDSMPASRRLRWTKSINHARAVSIAEGGPALTALDAFSVVRWGNVIGEFQKAFKFYSGREVSEGEVEIENLLKQYTELSKTDEEAARELMRANPELAASLNASMDPVEKEQLDEGYRIFNRLYLKHQKRIEDADRNGTLINEFADLQREFSRDIDRLTNPQYTGSTYNEIFAKYFGKYSPAEFIEALGTTMPIFNPESVWVLGRAKTDDEKNEYKAENLTPAFEAKLVDYGLTPKNSGSLLYQMLQDDFVNIPLSEWCGETEYQMVPYAAQSAAQYLARGGETGVFRSDAFLSLVKEQTFRKWMGAGIGGTGKATTPLMGLLSDEQCDLLGWNRSPEVRDAWRQYAVVDWSVRLWAANNGVSTSSTLFKETMAAYMNPTVQRLSTIPGFKNEYDFSKLRMHERLIAFGVGTGIGYSQDVAENQGMTDFLDICSRYWDELDSLEVGPTAQAAFKTWKSYIKQVAALAKSNDEWWQMFRGTYPLSKFGFTTKWKETSSPDIQGLFWGEEDMPDETETSWYE